MNSLFFIAKNNIKKHKGEVAILFALIFISALLLFSSLSLIMSASNTIKECDEKYHVADLMAFANGITLDEMKDKVKDIDEIEKAEFVPMIQSSSDYYYNDMNEDDAISYAFYFFDSSRPTYLNAFPEEFNNLKDDEIVLPYYMSYTVNAGDDFYVKAGDKTYSFKIKGFAENLYFATSMNLSGLYTLVSHRIFDEMSANLDPTSTMPAALFRIKEGADLQEFDVLEPGRAPLGVVLALLGRQAGINGGVAGDIPAVVVVVLREVVPVHEDVPDPVDAADALHLVPGALQGGVCAETVELEAKVEGGVRGRDGRSLPEADDVELIDDTVTVDVGELEVAGADGGELLRQALGDVGLGVSVQLAIVYEIARDLLPQRGLIHSRRLRSAAARRRVFAPLSR